MNTSTIGLDIAKNVFVYAMLSANGTQLKTTKLKRAHVLQHFAQLPASIIGIEACPGAHYWARALINLGHEVKLLPAQYVKPFLRGDKTDARDALAIAEALGRPNMSFVQINTEAQQDLQSLHRVRQRVMRDRVSVLLQIRGLLYEYGIVFAQGASQVLPALRAQLSEDSVLSARAQDMFRALLAEVQAFDARIKELDLQLTAIAAEDERAALLNTLPGLGLITITATLASVGSATHFRSGRAMAQCLGIVPGEFSSGGKQRQTGIHKRGNVYLRTLFIQCARSLLGRSKDKTGPLLTWATAIKARSGFNVAAVALANKLVRIAWVILSRREVFDERKLLRV